MSDYSQFQCCVDHLVRTGRGVLSKDGQFITNANHCRDGERARCSTCLRVWVHVCDEAEGCSWNAVEPKAKKVKTSGQLERQRRMAGRASSLKRRATLSGLGIRP